MLILLNNYIITFYNRFSPSSFFSFRIIMSLFMSFFLSYMFNSFFITWLKKRQVHQIIKKYGPKSHFNKCNTPTMGGVVILLSILISILIWSNLLNIFIWYILFTLISYGIIGFIDDYIKILHKDSDGLKPIWKYFWQSIIAIFISIMIFFMKENILNIETVFSLKKELLKLNFFYYIILVYLVIVGTSNAVNLTDGLDGLAIMQVISVTIGLGTVAYTIGNNNYSNIFDTNDVKEIALVCIIIIGSSLGFLWFNIYPAKIFMGDTGSLSLGSVIGIITVLLQQELLLTIMGGIFLIETLSVILQVLSFKFRGKCIFLMAPIHHHFELRGWSEQVIVTRFWIISLLLVIVGLLIFNLNLNN